MSTLRVFGQDRILSVSASLTWSGRDFLSACFDVHRDDVSTAQLSSLSSDKKSKHQRALTTSIACSNCVSLLWRSASRDRSTENAGVIPLFSSVRPCQVK